MNDGVYAAIFNQVLTPVARQYEPELILVSAGYDIYHGDPLGTMAVSEAGFAYLTRVVKELAGELCNGRVVLTLEGGYSLQGLRDGVLATLGEMAGEPFLPGLAERVAILAEARFGTPGNLKTEVLATLRRAYASLWHL